jgi:hypothetical protein
MNFHDEKDRRRIYYARFIYGHRLVQCVACAGSGRYDHNGSPQCGACGGKGKTREKGPRALALRAWALAQGRMLHEHPRFNSKHGLARTRHL